jgi:type IV secretion system protein VirB9
VQFYYPRETLQRFAEARAAHALAVERQQRATAHYEQDNATAQRNYHYRVDGPDMPWKPDTVFDDGTRVFLLMPPGFRTSTAPVLYVSRNGAEEQVNYTVRDSYYVIENLFERAVLLTDVGKHQQRVIIERY